MIETNSKRDPYWDIVKSIGIISIVIGHASWNIEIGKLNIEIGGFVYLYHLAIFFFCSGYLYNDEATDWLEYVKKKIKALYVPFIKYYVFWMIARNLCIKIGIVDGHIFNISENIINFTNVITFNGFGEFLGALWFLPVMFFAMCIYSWIAIICHKIPGVAGVLLRIFICAIIGAIGLFATESNYGLLFNMQVVYLMLPIIEVGHLVKKLPSLKQKYLVIILCAVCAFLLGSVIHFHLGYIELSKFMIISRWLFYPVTFVGIVFCLTLARIISWVKVSNIFAYIGRHSFDIMALHFWGIKIVDLIVCTIKNCPDDMAVFPHTFNNIWFIYYIVGVSFPLLCVKVYNYLKSCLIKKRSENL